MVRKIAIIIFTLLLGTEIGLLIKMYELFAYWIIPPILILLALMILRGDKWLGTIKNWLKAKLLKEYAWLFNLELEQRTNLTDYLHLCVNSMDFSKFIDSKRIKVHIRFFNMSIFTIDLAKVKALTTCNADEVGDETIDFEQRFRWGRWKDQPIQLTLDSQKARDAVMEANEQNKNIHWQFTLTLSGEVPYLSLPIRPFTRQLIYEGVPKIPKS